MLKICFPVYSQFAWVKLSYEKSNVGIIRGNHAVVVWCGFDAMMSPRLCCVFKCTINNSFQGYFNKLCDKTREDGGSVGWSNRRNLHVWPSCNLSLQQMAGITVSFIIYSQWAPLTLMLTAAPGNGLLNSNTCSWLICLLSKGLGWPEATLYHDTPLNGGRTLGAGRFDRRQWDSREVLWCGESTEGLCMWSHCGLLELEFPEQHQPGGIVVKMVYAQSVDTIYPVDIVGTLLFLINGLLLMVWSLCLCVSGRTGVLPFNHQVLLQRCSWGSASLWHHKVRPNSYDCHISLLLLCFTILSSPVSVLHYKIILI